MTQPDPRTLAAALWPQQTPSFDRGLPLDRRQTADVVIVGAGYSGLSAALHLAERGLAVAIIEADRPGGGASGRNAAGWCPIYFDKSPADVVRLLGTERGGALNRMVAESARLVPALVQKHAMPVDMRQSGIAVVSEAPGSAADQRKLAQGWNDAGGNVAFLGSDALHAIMDSRRAAHGLLFRDAGTLNPFAYAVGLARAAVAAGARLFMGDPARRMTETPGGWLVETAHGSVAARHVLIATEGYEANATLWPGLERTHYRLPFAMVASAPVPEFAARIMPAGIPLTDTNKGNPFWIMADPDGRLVASLLPPLGDGATAAQVAQPLERKLRRLFGDVPAFDWSQFWIGTVAVSAERIPRLLALAPRVHAIGGYSGQGIGAATAAGREYAKLVADDDRAACRLPVLDPRPLPLRRAVPFLFRNVAAPLGRATDRSYHAAPKVTVAD